MGGDEGLEIKNMSNYTERKGMYRNSGTTSWPSPTFWGFHYDV